MFSGKPMTIYIPPEEGEALKLYAKRIDRSRSWVVRQAITRFLNQEAEGDAAKSGK